MVCRLCFEAPAAKTRAEPGQRPCSGSLMQVPVVVEGRAWVAAAWLTMLGLRNLG